MNTRLGWRSLVLAGAWVSLCGAVFAVQPSGDDPHGAANVWRASFDRSTGHVSFMTSALYGLNDVNAPSPSMRLDVDAFLAEHGPRFGLENAAQDLHITRRWSDALGAIHTEFRQKHRNLPVFGGALRIHCGSDGNVYAANGHLFPVADKFDLRPNVTVDAARRAVIAEADQHMSLTSAQLVIVDPGWYGDPVLGARLAWYLELEGVALGEWATFVDAHSGELLDRWQLNCGASSRSIYDGEEGVDLPGALVRPEGDPPTGDTDVDAAYDYAGDMRAFLQYGFGRHSWDDADGPIVITVRTGAAACPNAFWSMLHRQAAFCSGTVADDMIAHELMHGVTQTTANLIYQNQSGQLNESFSDIFGELADLFNSGAEFPGAPLGPPSWANNNTGFGSDVANRERSTCSDGPLFNDGVRWLIAEDGAAWNGPLRDMWDPPCEGDPDRANSALQTCSLGDNGGVHSGSGVLNHAFAIICDGKAFNGYDVRGIGAVKAAAIWYRALTVYLTVTSDFEDAYSALNQAAVDLVGIDPIDPRTGLASGHPITADDVLQVDLALRAVELNSPGACGGTVTILSPVEPAICLNREVIYASDFESNVTGWTVSNSSPPSPYDWELRGALPAGRSGHAFFVNDPNLGPCEDSDESGLHQLISPVVSLPDNAHLPQLTFRHYVETEPKYDGGRVLLRVNNEPWTPVPQAAFLHNSYNTTLFTTQQQNTNPIAGELTFSGADGNWGVSVIDLSLFASGGDNVQVMFEFAKDACFGITGWFVDDLEIHHCPDSTDCNGNRTADELDLLAGEHRDVWVSQPPNHSSGNPSDLDNGGLGVTAMADNFIVPAPIVIEEVRLWGGYYRTSNAGADAFTLRILADEGAGPGAPVAERLNVGSERSMTGGTFIPPAYIDEYEYALRIAPPIALPAGTYYLEILNDTTGNADTFIWGRAAMGHLLGAYGAFEAPGQSWIHDPLINMAFELLGPVTGIDCNTNAVPDECDRPGDANGDGIVSTTDIAAFAACMTGPASTATPECLCMLDADGDSTLDLADFAVLQQGTAINAR